MKPTTKKYFLWLIFLLPVFPLGLLVFPVGLLASSPYALPQTIPSFKGNLSHYFIEKYSKYHGGHECLQDEVNNIDYGKLKNSKRVVKTIETLYEWEIPVKKQYLNLLNFHIINKCIYRGNDNYFDGKSGKNKIKEGEAINFLIKAGVNNIYNFDHFADHNKIKTKIKKLNKKRKYRGLQPISWVHLPFDYTKVIRQDAKTILNFLFNLGNANLKNSFYIHCYWGKHRTGLISALYKFLVEYSMATRKDSICKNYQNNLGQWKANLNDPLEVEMRNLGILYKFIFPVKMNDNLVGFYRAFAKGICKNNLKLSDLIIMR